ncbi:hypothetical protein F66182_7811 [Fusarium sp. NRRL 66182]|nr:hypothetical protein F66182_7811 [Fusarium sp. NRRL 66182]
MALIEEHPTPYHCITQPRCRLCQFELEDGDAVYAVCYHDSCYEFRFYSVTLAFLDATLYSFEPSAREKMRRTRYIRQELSRNLQRTSKWPRELPAELWHMVAGYLLEDCATLTAQEQVYDCDNTGESELDLTRSVFASFVKVDGLYYVKDLHNTAEASTGMQTCVLPAATMLANQEKKQADKDLFVAQDHLGIRRFVFVSAKHCEEWCRNPPNVPGAWWKHIPCQAMSATVCIKRDGLKVRDIKRLQTKPSTLSSHVGWQVPVATPPAIVDILTTRTLNEYPNDLRMRFFDCNAPGTMGYSVAVDGARVLAILTHKQDQKTDASLFEGVNSPICQWMYMPINQGEYLTDICRRAGCLVIKTETLGMTFTTNRGRTAVFGLYGHKNIGIRRLAALSPNPSRVYFNDTNSWLNQHSVALMGFEQGKAIAPFDNLPKLPVAISNYPSSISSEVWLHTSCSMAHLTEIQPCVDKTRTHQPIIGMLLHYADGHRECVGQFRLDWASELIMLSETDNVFICGKRTGEGRGYVSTITASAPVGDSSERWLHIEQTGTLEWWFSLRHSVLYYNGVRLN